MDSNTRFEILAEAFYRTTGIMAPGKDDRMMSHTMDERCSAYTEWLNENYDTINAILAATVEVLDL